jgi:hypothetical protein
LSGFLDAHIGDRIPNAGHKARLEQDQLGRRSLLFEIHCEVRDHRTVKPNGSTPLVIRYGSILDRNGAFSQELFMLAISDDSF